MIYTVKRIEEDLDFGCEERPKGMPVMAIVTLTNSSGEEIRIKAEDAMLYEYNINEGDKVFLFPNLSREYAHLFISNHIELQSNALVCLWKHIRRNRIMQLPYETDRSLSFMLHIICIS